VTTSRSELGFFRFGKVRKDGEAEAGYRVVVRSSGSADGYEGGNGLVFVTVVALAKGVGEENRAGMGWDEG